MLNRMKVIEDLFPEGTESRKTMTRAIHIICYDEDLRFSRLIDRLEGILEYCGEDKKGRLLDVISILEEIWDNTESEDKWKL